MQLLKRLRPYYLEIIFLSFFLSLYLICAPLTVQSGDTGELVTNSYHLRVSHPPGYPLYNLLFHLPVRYLNFGNPFFAASVTSLFFVIGVLALLIFAFRSLDILLLLGVLASSTLFWKMAVLPDVFSLHLLFLGWISLMFIKPKLLHSLVSVFLCALSVTNHHTILFVLPLFIYAALYSGYSPGRILGFSLVSGLLSFSLYLILLYYHPSEYGSWGDLQSWRDVFHHFLRTDYGTFSLAKESDNSVNWPWFFFQRFFSDLWSVLGCLLFILYKYRSRIYVLKTRLLIWGICFISYFLTFMTLAKVSLDQEGELIFERFLLQPSFLIVILLLMLIHHFKIRLPRFLKLVFVINLGLNLLMNFPVLYFRKSTSLHDYVTNIFRAVPYGQALYIHGDTLGFSSYYLHSALKFRPDVKLIQASSDKAWSRRKLTTAYPELFYREYRSLFRDFNFEKYRLFTNYYLQRLPQGFGVVARGTVYEIRKINKEEPILVFACPLNYDRQRHLSIKDFEVFDIAKFYDQSYGHCHFQQAINLILQDRYDDALTAIGHATRLSPFNAKYLERKCFLLKKINSSEERICDQQLENLLLKTNSQYYLEKF
jgi:hypothetical protein